MTPLGRTDSLSLERYLHLHIPISKDFGLKVVESSPRRVVLKAPLEPNLNHKKTAFGGSLHAVATLSCWALLHLNLRPLFPRVEIVISSSTIRYLSPVREDFTAVSEIPSSPLWEKFLTMLRKKGKSRIRLDAEIKGSDFTAVTFSADFVAIIRARDSDKKPY